MQLLEPEASCRGRPDGVANLDRGRETKPVRKYQSMDFPRWRFPCTVWFSLNTRVKTSDTRQPFHFWVKEELRALCCITVSYTSIRDVFGRPCRHAGAPHCLDWHGNPEPWRAGLFDSANPVQRGGAAWAEIIPTAHLRARGMSLPNRQMRHRVQRLGPIFTPSRRAEVAIGMRCGAAYGVM